MPADVIPRRLLDRAATDPDGPAWHTRTADGRWAPCSWKAYASEVQTAARALMALGMEPGHTLCILGFNRPEWTTLDLAAMMCGGVPAGIYTTCSASEIQYIVDHAEARIVLVESAEQLARVLEVRDRLPRLAHIVLMEGLEHPAGLTWRAFLARGLEVPASALAARLDAIAPADLATLIYTSGTTGPPKAVMLTHANLTFTANVARDMVSLSRSDRMISYLPLSHIAEQMFSLHVHLTVGYALYFARSMEQLRDDIQEVRPTILFGVPRVWEKMHAGIQARLGAATGLRKRLVGWAQGVGREVNALRNRGQEPSGLLALQYRLASRLVFSKFKGVVGLDALRFGVSGAAPIAGEVLAFFSGLDLMVHEVYGQSEGSGPTTFNLPGQTKFGTVGRPIPGVEVRIADDGEVLVRGGNVFAGYLKDEAATRATVVDGWLCSGDVGAFDADGYLRITGRKKEIIITSGGKNITPTTIETLLMQLPLVGQAVVIGDRRHYLTALLTLDPVAAAAFAQARGLPVDGLHAHPDVLAEIQHGVDQAVNPELARVEHVRKFTVLPRELSIEHGELTPTMKVKRRVVDQHFAAEIEAMYAG